MLQPQVWLYELTAAERCSSIGTQLISAFEMNQTEVDAL